MDISRLLKINPERIAGCDIANEWRCQNIANASGITISQLLHKYELYGRVAVKKSFISEKNQRACFLMSMTSDEADDVQAPGTMFDAEYQLPSLAVGI